MDHLRTGKEAAAGTALQFVLNMNQAESLIFHSLGIAPSKSRYGII
jgi:hypothetical protein